MLVAGAIPAFIDLERRRDQRLPGMSAWPPRSGRRETKLPSLLCTREKTSACLFEPGVVARAAQAAFRVCSGVILKAIGASSQDSLISIKPARTSLKRGDDLP